ncbi:unnamed protein product [Linum tenue]|uniref:Cytochrome P450 n=1 Tax=Linum tenue TaxID=586396 RepID=A0AAV0KJW7_9ROSI|nr:unnamed protein product [Linum tenue]
MEEASYNQIYHYGYFLLPLLFLSIYYLLTSGRRGGRKLPPVPPGALPIVGHMRLLKHPVHRAFQALARDHGPIFSLRLGSQRAVVVSSAALAEECFTKNDIVFGNRPHFILGKHLEYDNTTVTMSPYGEHWRNLRRIGAVEIFSTARVNSFTSIRREEVHRIVARLMTGGRQRVELTSAFNDLAFNNMTRMVAGKRYYGGGASESDAEVAKEFTKIMKEVAELGGATNAVDFVPLMRWLDRGRFEKTVKELAGNMDRFFQGLIEEHKSKEEKLESTSTMIDRLIALQENDPESYDDQLIKGLALVTLEWIMSNLLNHPDVLAKARDEIENQIGSDRLIEETDLPNLPYLHNIISETQRLYPPTPMLVPRISTDDCVVGGYHVPRDTILIVNAFAIHRDPSLWDDPTTFRPERFDEISGAKEGGRFLAFGMGRRSCAGQGVALRVVGLTLGTLIQCFDWERVGEGEVDMAEAKGITMPRETPLEAVCVPRPNMKRFFP